jgi:hypothetical protein
MNLNLAAQIERATRKRAIFRVSHRDEASLDDDGEGAPGNDAGHALLSDVGVYSAFDSI